MKTIRKNKKRWFNQFSLFWPLVTPYKKQMLVVLIFLALAAVASLSLPVTIKAMIDIGFSAELKDQLFNYFLVMFIVATSMVVFSSLKYYLASWVGQRVVTDLRKKIYSHILIQSSEFFEKTRTGEILSRINTDTTLIAILIGSTFSIALTGLVTLIGALAMMFFTNIKLAVMIICLIPLIIIPIRLTGKRIQTLSKIERDKFANSSALATETINAIHVVHSYAQENKENSKYQSAIDKAFQATIDSIKMITIMSMLVGFVVFSGILFVLWMGSEEVIKMQMTVGTLSQFIIYSVMASSATSTLSKVWGSLKKAAGALEKISELLNSQPNIQNVEARMLINNPSKGQLKLENIDFAYPSSLEMKIFSNLSLDIKSGETVAIVGPSGAGKSTLFQLLMRFYEPLAGNIYFDGIDVKQVNLANLRSQFALVAQDVTIFSTTAENNILYGVDDSKISKNLLIKSSKIAHAEEFIMKLEKDYQTYLGEKGVRLSGGQAQRLSIARAIATNPAVLLLDEATSALDAENEHLVQDALNQIMQDRTTLVIAHRLATIRRADRILVMDQGAIIAEGKHKDLLVSNKLYAKLARLQFTDN